MVIKCLLQLQETCRNPTRSSVSAALRSFCVTGCDQPLVISAFD